MDRRGSKMKKYFSFTNILVIIIFILLFIEYFPYGIKNYKIKDNNIKVPRMTYKVKATKNELIFNSFRDYSMLKRDIKKILKEYKVIKDNNKQYYYDLKQNIIIKKYELKKGFLINKIIIKYE